MPLYQISCILYICLPVSEIYSNFSDTLLEFLLSLIKTRALPSFYGWWLTIAVGQRIDWPKETCHTQVYVCYVIKKKSPLTTGQVCLCKTILIHPPTKSGAGCSSSSAIRVTFQQWWRHASYLVNGTTQKGLNSIIILGAWTIWQHIIDCVFNGKPSIYQQPWLWLARISGNRVWWVLAMTRRRSRFTQSQFSGHQFHKKAWI
jgi:hypothetical protein